MKKIYLAAPIVNIPKGWKKKIEYIKKICSACPSHECYFPDEHGVPNAWGMSMNEWTHCIFTMDVIAIDNADWVIVCDFGRDATAGTAWETGYAFGQKKKILIIHMNENDSNYSVMLEGCSSNSISYDELINRKVESIEGFLFERGRMQSSQQIFN